MRVGKEGGRRVILRRIRDVQKLSGLRESCLAVVLAAEGQRNVHYAMPVRCMLYDAMDYTRQVERMVKKRREEGKLEKGAEYLSGMKREDRLLPVITIVFYYGEEQSWDGPLYLHDMLDIPPELEPWAACIQDYRVNLVCSGTVESSHFRTGLREVFELLPLLKDKEGMKEFLKTRREEFMHLDAKRGWLVSKFLNVPALKDLKENEKGEVNRVLSISYPYKAPDLGLCDVYRNGTVVMCNNGVVSEFSVQNNRLAAKNISSMFLPLDYRYAGAVISYHGKIWLGTNRGLYNSAKQEFHASGTVHSLQHEVVTSLAITEDDKLLVGTLCGVDIIDDKTGTIEHWNCSSVNPLSSNFVNSLLAKDGQIWVGTETGGITKLAPRQLQLEFFKHDAANPASLSPNAVNAMYAAPDGTLWVGTVEGGLNALAPDSRNFTHYTMANSGLPHNSVSTLAADNRGNLWIGTWGTGIAVMNLQQPGRIIPLVVDAKHQPFLNFAGVLVYDPINDGMWLGTNDGLFFYDLKRQQLIEPFKGCLNVRGCIGSLITRDGKLLMGCVQGMVEINLKSRIPGKGDFAVKYHQYRLDDPKSGVIDKILSFCLAKDGKIWLGSNGYGLYCYNYNKEGKTYVKSFTTNNGLANNTVKGIVEDNQGMLWIATDNGLSIFNPKTETFSNYSRKDGLLSSQFYFNGAIRDAKGKIYLVPMRD